MATAKTPVIEVVIRDEVTAALERSRQRMQHADSGFNFKGLTAGLRDLGTTIQGVAHQLSSLTGLGALMGGGFVAGVVKASNALADLSRSTLQMNYSAEALGLTAKQFETWVARGQMLGMSVEQSKAGVTSLAQLIDKLVVFGPRAAQFSEVYKSLGGPQFLEQVRRAAQTGGTQAGIEAYLGGMSQVKDRRGQSFLAEFAGLGPGWANAARLDASKLGNIYQLNASDAAKYNLEMLKLKISFSNVSKEVAVAVMPAMTSMIQTFDKFLQGPGGDLARKFGSWLSSIDIDWDKIAKNLIGLIDAATRFVDRVDPIIQKMGGWTPILLGLGAAVGLAGLGGGLKVWAAGLAAIGASAWVVPMLVTPAKAAEAQQGGGGTRPPGGSGTRQSFRRRGAAPARPAPLALPEVNVDDEGDGTAIPQNAQPRSGGPGGQGYYVPGHGYIKTDYNTKQLRKQVREVRTEIAHLASNIEAMGLVSDDTGAGGLAALGGVLTRLNAPTSGAPGGGGGRRGGGGGGSPPGGGGPAGSAGDGSPEALSKDRQKFAEEMKNPAIRARMLTLAVQEVGHNPRDIQQFIETIFNRASARRQSLLQAMQTTRAVPGGPNAGQYPNLGNPRRVTADDQKAFDEQTVPGVIGGSDYSNRSTGNASGTVNRTYPTRARDSSGRERYVLEKDQRDETWHKGIPTRDQPAQSPQPARPDASGGPGGGGDDKYPPGTAGHSGIRPLFPVADNVNWKMLDAEYLARINRAYADMPGDAKANFKMISGYRPATIAEAIRLGMSPSSSQEDIWRRSRGGTLFAAAPPGRSNHQAGEAGDYQEGAGRDWLRANAGRYGVRVLRNRRGQLFDFPHVEKDRNAPGNYAGSDPTRGPSENQKMQSEFDAYLQQQKSADERASLFTRARARNIGLNIRVRGPRGVKVSSDSSGDVAPATIERSMDATGGGRIESPA